MSKLILTVGLPQSGKSTWAKEQGHPIVNRDSIRFALGGTIRYFKEEAKVSEIEKIMVKALFKAGHDKVIVDATHLKEKYITAWEEFAKNPWDKTPMSEIFPYRNYLTILMKFYTPLEECIERAQRNFPEDTNFPAVIRSMWENAKTIDVPEFKEIITDGDSRIPFYTFRDPSSSFGTWAFAEPVRVQQEQKYEVADWKKKRNLNRQIHRRNKRIYQRKKRQQRRAVHHFAHHNRGCFISTLQED